MSTMANAAVVLGGAGLSGLWDYNRTNYMFDIPLMQNKAFQIQNLGMNRFAMFREDIRDLASLTIDKVQSYLIVNTLKLGFIVSIFFNFDRSSAELDDQNFLEAQVDILIGAFFCGAFFWLLTSIWYSMHAVIVAQSITTKLLLQVVRLPAPVIEDVHRLPSSSLHFERNLSSTFRLPFMGRAAAAAGAPGQQHSTPAHQHGVPTPRSGLECPSPGSGCRGGSRASIYPSTASTSFTRLSASPVEDEQVDMEAAPWDLRLGRGCSGANSGAPGLRSIAEILDGCDACLPVRSTGEAHLKLFNLLRSNWSSFDLYGRISMVLGTVNLLMGISFYSLYYFRSKSGPFYVEPSGWLCFVTFSVLTWWCILFELSVSKVKHVLVAIAIPGSCILFVLLDIILHPNGVEDAAWIFSMVAGLSAFWEIALCWSGVPWRNRWPMHWRCSFFLNPLHTEVGPAERQADIPGSWLAGPADAGPFPCTEAPAALMSCLDLVLSFAPLAKAEAANVRGARDRLHEMCRAAGALTECPRPLEGFWLVLPAEHRLCWIDPRPAETKIPVPDSLHVSLEELLKAAHQAALALHSDAGTWTQSDMERLAASGGDPVVSPCRFVAQFHADGSGAKHPLGTKASVMYVGGCVLTSLVWIWVSGYSCFLFANRWE